MRYRSKRPDYILIDDLDDDELCQNEARVRKLTDWVKEALFGTLDGGRGRFSMVGNLISKNSVLANIAASKGINCTQVNALDKNGRVSWSSKWTIEEVRAEELFMGYRSFQKEKMNNPITEGQVFKNEWIKYKKMLPLNKYDYLIMYCDPSFKSSRKNDYKAIKLWGKIGTELHQITAFVRQCSVTEMVRWWHDRYESLPEDVVCFSLYGDKRRKPEKWQRIEAVSPLWERGFVYYNIDKKDDPDTMAGLEQTLAFEKGGGAHDDAPNADEGAIYILQKQTRIKNFAPRIGRRATHKNSW